MNHPPTFRTSRDIVVTGFYGVMGLAGLGLIWWRVEDRVFNPFGFPGEHPVQAGLSTILIVLLVAGLTEISLRYWASVRRSARTIRTALGPLTPAGICLLALLSGLGEELFFRGWLLNETGLVISSLLFGAVHVPRNRDWLYWPVFAFAMGLVLGLVCLWTDTLYWAVLIHAGVNGLNLHRVYQSDTLNGG